MSDQSPTYSERLKALHDLESGAAGINDETHDALRWAIGELGKAYRLRAENATLREYWQALATDWQWGGWADPPRRADRVEERLANAQYVTNWLRMRVDAALTASTQGGEDDE